MYYYSCPWYGELELRKFISANRKPFLFLTWQMFTLISILSAIILIVYLSRYALLFLAGHCLLLTVFYTSSGQPFCDRDGMDFFKILFSHFLATYPSFYHPANLKGILPIEKHEAKMILAYIFIHLENILIVALSTTIEFSDTIHMDGLKPISFRCHVGGTVLSFIFFYS